MFSLVKLFFWDFLIIFFLSTIVICNLLKSTISKTTVFLKPYLKTFIFVGKNNINLVKISKKNKKI